MLLVEHEARALGDPRRGDDVGGRTPEVEEREGTEFPLDLVLQIVGLAVDAGDLPAVGGIRRARRDAPVGTRVHVVPPEELRAGQPGQASPRGLPHLLAGDQMVRLAPQPRLAEVAEVPAVADDAVVAGQRPGEHCRLGAARHRRQDRAHRPHEAAARERRQRRGVGADLGGSEPDDVDDEKRGHLTRGVRGGRSCPRRAGSPASPACRARGDRAGRPWRRRRPDSARRPSRSRARACPSAASG